ncbi:AAA ATPase central domain protein [Thalassoporum mexicanum PCC 7367]|uniref:ATP-binding protein n=1 Tax=Thalassoporum mexicanum TaxID=3457544 RepID=UPI00029FB6FE|nr:ATP-binding protein [Pseudanabaena sp. PCC 7367]AFY70343.1 AAA ATPase central domain protein [Pseudanabaena sp. PCC 7367]
MIEVPTLQSALRYLSQVIQWRIESYFATNPHVGEMLPKPPLDWLAQETALSKFIEAYQLDIFAQLTLIIALAPHLQPDFFDRAITAQLPEAGDYPQIGGCRGVSHRGFLPTGDTVLFILGGTQLSDRIRFQKIFSPNHLFVRKQVLSIYAPTNGEPLMSGRLVLSQEYVNLFIYGYVTPPHFNTQFPAQRITTNMQWDDLVLNAQTLEQIYDLETWIIHSPTLLNEWGMKRNLNRGYRALFYGSPGTGKTLTACLLGKYTNKEVYKVDVSMVVSKFIGETEKNLAALFTKAESKDWILFFDEADALFGKRTNVRDAHDKYANQEISYLLQRVENYDGLVILASNLKSNIDDAFVRRFQSIIHFPMPDAKARLRLWQLMFPQQVRLDKAIDFQELADLYELSGADIMNVVQYCCLQALKHGKHVIYKDGLSYAIKREFNKVGKIFT